MASSSLASGSNELQNNYDSIIQVCPIQKGNPVITFEVDYFNGFVVCGLASGAVDCWILPHALGGPNTAYTKEERKHEMDAKSTVSMKKDSTLKANEMKYSKYYCRRMIYSDFESVRHIYLKHRLFYHDNGRMESKDDNERMNNGAEFASVGYQFDGLASIVGDRFVREWDSYDSINSVTTSYNHTSHDSAYCDQAQIIGHESHVILYPKTKHHSLIYVNLDNTSLQKQIKLPYLLGSDCTLMDFDGRRLIYRKVESNGHKTIGLIDLNLGSIDHDLKLLHKDKVEDIVTTCHADDIGINWILQRSRKEYWGFQLNTDHEDRIAYVSNQNNIKIYSLKSNNVQYKLSGHKPGFILTFEHQKDLIISLGSDRTVRIWYVAKIKKKSRKKKNNLDGNETEMKNDLEAGQQDENGIIKRKEELDAIRRRHLGRCIYVKENIIGSFVPGYLYKVRLVDKTVFYSSDNGVFGFNVKLPYWCET